ncbi:O-antigen ligase [Acetomicrobium thermoterrenum DSM 13490]|uniref:O-antigen ligase n=1 Tax=Acetomicrobium thermoterrenum DSM 13490 TaxID=1120987 RepID=A0A1H3FG35_9BACT|nr:O-antigen ligase family protein [Acetomicrobium thermoterrenum]SDX90073.1 O-antigen ligase [Acetomicrobium thermoterrenum DSM 13490]
MNEPLAKTPSWPMSLIAFGFYFSLFCDPWGPIPRYFGWLLSIIGIVGLFILQGSKLRKPVLDPAVKIIIYIMIIWSVFTTLLNFYGWYHFGKGVSNPLEAVFGIWLTAFVVSKEGTGRFQKVWWASSVLIFVACILQAVNVLKFSVFSHHNTLGLYAVVTLPMSLNFAVRRYDSRLLYVISSLTVVLNLIALFLSFSSGPWLVGGIEILLFLIIARPGKYGLFKGLLIPLLITAILGFAFALIQPTYLDLFKREISQLTSFSGDFSKFTTNRTRIWEKTAHLISQKPITGWGWIRYKTLFLMSNFEAIPGVGIPVEPHNMYIQLLTYGGFPLLIIVVGLMLRGAWLAWMKFKSCKGENKYLYAAVLATILAILVYSMGGSVFAARQKIGFLFWALYGIAAALPERGKGKA